MNFQRMLVGDMSLPAIKRLTLQMICIKIVAVG